MKFRVIDFDILTRNFQPYVDGYKKIESEKRRMIDSIDPYKREMEGIIKSATNGLIMDELTQKRQQERFREIQEVLMKKDTEFKTELKKMQEEMNEDIFSQISQIVKEWSESNSIDVVIGKMEVVFAKPEFEATNDILEIFKQKSLHYQPEQSEAISE